MRRLMSQGFLLSIIGLMGLALYLTLGSATQAIVVPLAAGLLIVGGLIVERLWPFKPSWNKTEQDVGGDLAALIANEVLLDGLLKWVLPVFVLWTLALFGPTLSPSIDWPLWLQIIAVSLLLELMAYASHRLHHRFRALWVLHATHHSPRRLYTLNNFRFHPLNYIVNALMMFVPVLLLGFSSDALLAYAALSLPVLALQHANIPLEPGWLNHVLNTNAVHRWHHSANPAEGNCNFGRATLLWDHVFGTFYLPHDRQAPEELGLRPGDLFRFPLPSKLFAQISYPFSANCCRAS